VTERTQDLDLLPTLEVLELMNAAEARAVAAVREVLPKVARAVDEIAALLRAGGRIHAFGAGTSGRLAVLDASEVPPTFGVPADLVQGHIAGGPRALTHAIEGAEDDADDGARQVAAAGVRRGDAVIAVTASGRTPWCLGVLRAARETGATTYAITCARPSSIHEAASLVIDPVTGDEVLRGSTRLSAGTAQKLVLNMISTGVMVRLGKTWGNLMVGVQPTNAKLRARARDVVRAVTGRSEGAEAALEQAGDDVPLACVILGRGVSRDEAARLLASAGSLRKALAPPAR
jgi:N-acetylmuramic acid 6-phosphate etherase